MTQLDVSHCPALEKLFCNHGQLTQLDVSQNSHLKELCCDANPMTSLDLQRHPNLNLSLSSLDQHLWLRTVTTDEQGRFDLSTLEGFDVERVLQWSAENVTVCGHFLTLNEGCNEAFANYQYDTLGSDLLWFALKLCRPGV